MNELSEILPYVSHEIKEKVIKLCANYEKEIKSLQLQYTMLEQDKAARYRVTDTKLHKACHNAALCLSRHGKCHLFYNHKTNKFRALSNKTGIAKESGFSELVGVYTGEPDRSAIMEDICALARLE